MLDSDKLPEKWEEAYIRQISDALCGRLVRGLLHNLNGIIQAFAMQSGLFEVMFTQAGQRLDKLADMAATPGQREDLLAFKDFLASRGSILPGIEEKIEACRRILMRVTGIGGLQESRATEGLNEIIEVELEFMAADMFFKHKVKKNVTHIPEYLEIGPGRQAAHFVLHELLANAVDALADSAHPEIAVTAFRHDAAARIIVEDNGPGVRSDLHATLFDAFVSVRTDRSGLGLYLARTMLARVGGTLELESVQAPTRFVLSIPLIQPSS